MKKIIIAIMILAISSGISMAASLTTVEKIESCKNLGAIAGRIMLARQVGAPTSKIISMLIDGEDDDIDDIVLTLIVAASHEPVYEDEEKKVNVSIAFREIVERECLDAAVEYE